MVNFKQNLGGMLVGEQERQGMGRGICISICELECTIQKKSEIKTLLFSSTSDKDKPVMTIIKSCVNIKVMFMQKENLTL